MTVNVLIGGQKYSGFLSARIQRSMETVCASFHITASALPGQPFPIKRSQFCQILIDNNLVLTGYIENLEVHYSVDAHEITLSGRDLTCDVVDSSLIGSKEFNAPISLQDVARIVLDDNGLIDMKVIDSTGGIDPFGPGEIVAAEVSQTLFEFLEKFCRKRQVFMTSNPNGDLVLIRAGNVNSGGAIYNILKNKNNNVLSSNVCYKETDRFNTYIVHSQMNTTSRSALALRNRVKSFVGSNRRTLNKHISAQMGEAVDSDIRQTRIKEIVSESASDINDCTNQAIWYSNVFRARSEEYRVKVQGFYIPDIAMQASKRLWQVNQLVIVRDDFCDISATLLIKDVEYNYSVNSGSTTELVLVDKEAFTLQALIDSQQRRINKQGDDLTDDDDEPSEDGINYEKIAAEVEKNIAKEKQ